MNSVAIIGVGLIGGSFALALRKAGFTGRIVGVSSRRTLEEALLHGIVDAGLPLAEALPDADLVFLAQPIARIIETLGMIDPLLKPGCLVTDAGSTKAQVVAAGGAIRRGQFLGGHPMAGKETRGAAASDANLFAGRTWVLTPVQPGELDTPRAAEFRAWLERLGAVPVVLHPAEHDRIVALTSHLPQLASTAFAAALGEQLHLPADGRAAGPAARDLTRLALSPFDVWKDILGTNTENIQHALDLYIARLNRYRNMLAGEGMRAEFDAAAQSALFLREPSPVSRIMEPDGR